MGGTAHSICWRPVESQILQWSCAAEAFEAATIIPCGRGCTGQHAAAYFDGRRIRIAAPPPPVFVLAAALAQLYPRLRGVGHIDGRPELWPCPPAENPTLTRRDTVTPEELRRAQDAAVAAAADRQLEPTPGGIPARVAAAHAEAAEAFAAGDIDGAIGADMLSAALTDTLLARFISAGWA